MNPAQINSILNRYHQHLISSQVPPATIKRKISSVSNYLKFLAESNSVYITDLINAKSDLAGKLDSVKIESDSISQLEELGIKVTQRISAAEIINQLLFIRISRRFFFGIKNTLKQLPRWPSLISYKLKYNRPKWIVHYQKLSFSRYLNLLMLVIVAVAIGIGGYDYYDQLTSKKGSVLGDVPTRPPTRLSFQGRLTDSFGNPIVTSTHFRFSLYNDESATGSAQLYEEAKWIQPDQDGIFNSLIGDTTAIPPEIFRENTNLYLGVTVNTNAEMTPRQQVATVGYAFNSEYLQGYPASQSAGINTIPIINSEGNMIIAAASPNIRSTTGSFTIDGQVVYLTTAGNGDINLVPNGTGSINLTSGATSDIIVNATGSASLSTGSLYYGEVLNNANTSYYLLRLASATNGTPVDRFTVDALGNTYTAGYATVSASLAVGYSNVLGGHGNGVFSGNVGIGTTSPTYRLEVNGTGRFTEALDLDGDLELNSTLTDINNNVGTSGQVLSSTGTGVDWIDSSSIGIGGSGTQYYLPRFSGTTTLENSQLYDSSVFVGIGGTAASTNPHLYVNASTGNIGIGTTNPTSKLSIAGASSISNSSGNLTISPASNLIIDSGNVGIGTTDPTYNLHVVGNGYFSTNLGVGGTATMASANITGALLDKDAGAGTNNQILKSTGTQVDWVDISSIGIGGSGTTNFLPKFTAATVLGNSQIYDDSTFVGIGGTAASTNPHLYVNAASGNVGIGTTDPLGDLHIEKQNAGGMGPQLILENPADWIENSAAQILFQTHDTNNIPMSRIISSLESIAHSGGSSIQLQTYNQMLAWNTGLYINHNGYVGIGTTNPTEQFVVYGNSSNNIASNFQNIDTTSTYGASSLNVMAGSTTGTIVALNEVYNANDYVYGSIPTSLNVINQSAGPLLFKTNGINDAAIRLMITSGGNVGVGTTNPLYLLDVNGSLGVGGTATFNNKVKIVDGSQGNNKVFTSDANGIGSWATLSSLPVGNADTTDNYHISGSANFIAKFNAANDTLVNSQIYDNATFVGIGGTAVSTNPHLYVNASSGNVGIGTTNPDYKLDINGSARIMSGGDLHLTSANDLIFNGTTALGETTAANDSGASLVGIFDEFSLTDSANVQDVIDDLDADIIQRAKYDRIVATDGTGTDTTIAAAIAAASAGDTIFVTSGTYSENIAIDKSLTLLGSGRINTILAGADGSATVTINAGISNVTIKGLTITNAGTTYNVINVGNGTARTGLTFNDLEISGGSKGIYLEDTSYSSITDSYIHDTASHGADYYTAADITVQNNTFKNVTAGYAVYCDTTSYRSIIQGNNIYNALRGIVTYGCYGAVVDGNTINTTGAHGITDNDSVSVTISNNTITTAGDAASEYGIYLYSTERSTITGNTIVDAYDDGIAGSHIFSYNIITNNTVYSSGGDGISIDATTTNGHTVTGNVLRSNGAYGIRIGAATDSTISSNVLSGNTSGGISDYSASKNNTFATNTVQGNEDLSTYTVFPATGSTYSGDLLQLNLDGLDANAFTGNGLHFVVDQSQNTGYLQLAEDDAGNDLFWLNELGAAYFASNVGIGTTNPSYLLEVNGSLGVGGTATFNNKVAIVDGTQTAGDVFTSDANGIGSWTAFSSIGIGGSGTQYYLPRFSGSTTLENSQLYDNSTFVGIGGTAPSTNPRLYVNASSGNVGIGTTNPSQQLEITGNLKLPTTTTTSGIIYMGNSPYIHSYGGGGTSFYAAGAGNLTTTGQHNTAIGQYALYVNETGSWNIALGQYDLMSNTSGHDNIALGQDVLSSNETGNENVAIGKEALWHNNTGSDNVALGFESLFGNHSGTYNVGLGYQVGFSLNSESYNTLIGYRADIISGVSNSTAIGKNAIVGASNSIILGGTGADAINVGIGTTAPTAQLYVGIGSTATVGQKIVLASGATANAFEINSSTGVGGDKFVIKADGNVGIGTTGPQANLDVARSLVVRGIDTPTSGAYGRFGWESSYGATGAELLSYNSTASTYRPLKFRASDFHFYPNGTTELVTILSSGNVGIGTTNPGAKLEVAGNILGSGNLVLTNLAFDEVAGRIRGRTSGLEFYATGVSAMKITTDGNVGIGTSAPVGLLHVAATAPFVITSAGQVGIGTTNPQGLFNVYGNNPTLRITGNADGGGGDSREGLLTFRNYASDAWSLGYSPTAGALVFGTGSDVHTAPKVTILNGGNVGIGTTAPSYKLDLEIGTAVDALRVLRASGTETLFAVQSSSGDLVISGGLNNDFILKTLANGPGEGFKFQNSGGTDLMFIEKDGNVGIGITAPGYKLDVNGSLGIGGTATFNNKVAIVDGTQTAGDVFTSDANGVGTWTAFSSIGIGGSGTQYYLPRFSGSTTLENSQLYDNSTFVGIGGTAPSTNPRLYVNAASGNVGIGTTNPTTKLEVAGDISFPFQGGVTKSIYVQAQSTGPGGVNGDNLRIAAADGYGAMGFPADGGDLYLSPGQGDNGGMGDIPNGDVLIGVTSTGTIIGNVGIGTTTPTYRLDVNGTGRFTGALDLDGDLELNSTLTDINDSVGTSGQVLSSTSTGVDWVDITSIGIGGSGTTNFIPKFTGANTLGLSQLFDDSTFVGIGGTAASTNPHLYINASSGNIGIGTTNPTYPLELVASNSVASTHLKGLNVTLTNSGDSVVNGTNTTGMYVDVTSSGAATNGKGIFGFGQNILYTFSGSTANDGIEEDVSTYGQQVVSSFSGTAGGAEDLIKIFGANITSTGDMGNVADTRHEGLLLSATGTAQQNYALRINSVTGGDVNYGIYITAPSVAAAGNYAIYSVVPAKSYLAGNLGIGTTVPSYALDIVGSANLSTGNEYYINGASVLNTNTLGTGVLTSSLTTVGALNAGSITSGFGSIDTGADNIVTTGTMGSAGTTTFTGNDLTLDNQFTSSYANPAAINLTGNTAGITFTGTGPNRITTAASQHLALMPGGNVGVGTTNPGYLLDVNGSLGVGGTATFNNKVAIVDGTQTAGDVFTSDANGVGSWTAFSSIGIGGSGTQYYLPRFSGSTTLENSQLYDNSTFVGIGGTAVSTNPHLYINASSGNVGIGTTEPVAPLEIYRSSSDIITQLKLNNTAAYNSDGTGSQIVFADHEGDDMFAIRAYKHGTPIMNSEFDLGIFSGGTFYPMLSTYFGDMYVHLGLKVTFDNGVTSAFYVNPNTQYVGVGTNNPISTLDVHGTTWLRGVASGTSGLFVDSNGNVGIGTTAPSYKLDVNGSLGVGGTATFNNKVAIVDGSQAAGDVFTSDANGVGSWTAFSSIGIGGSGTQYYLPRFSGSTTLENSQLYDNSTFVGIGGTAPSTNPRLYVNAASGNVGIGTTNPTQALDLSSGNLTLSGSILGGNTPPSATVLSESLYLDSSFNSSGSVRNVYIDSEMANTVDGAQTMQGLFSTLRTSADSTANYSATSNGGALKNRYNIILAGSGTVTQASSITTALNVTGGSLTNGTGIHIESPTISSGKTVTNFYGLWVRGGSTTGTLTNRYGVYVDDLVGGTNRFGIYQAGATDYNYFAGNVGIGTTAPGYLLDVNGSLGVGGTATFNNKVAIVDGTQAAGDVFTSDANGVGTWTAFSSIGIGGSGTQYYLPRFSGSTTLENSQLYDNSTFVGIGGNTPATNPHMYINAASGGVGIGTTDPQALLDVAGGAHFLATISNMGSSTALTSQYYTDVSDVFLSSSTVGDFYFRFMLNADGKLNFGSGSTDVDTNLYRGKANYLFTDDSLSVAGNVGIGTTDPTYKLHVVGNGYFSTNLGIGGTATMATAYITGALLDKDAGAGTNGQILSSTGTGVDWIDAPNTGIGGSGTTNYLPKFTAGTTIGNSQIFDNATFVGIGGTAAATNPRLYISANSGNIGIGTTNPSSLLHLSSTSTSTSFSGANFDWSPTSATTTTADLFKINIGPYGTANSLLNIFDNNSSLFSVSETAVTSNLPAAFTVAGDTSMAYDLLFSNQIASYIKTNASFTIDTGENWESNNLTLKTYNAGKIILESANLWANGTNVGIGTTSPGSKLSVDGGISAGAYSSFAAPSNGMIISGNVGIGTTDPSSYAISVVGTAGLSTGTAWTNTSDYRFKDISADLTGSSLEKILALHPIEFHWNQLHHDTFDSDTNKVNYGFVAQEVNAIMPSMISQDANGYYYYNPSGFEAILTAGIQEMAVISNNQQLQIADLNTRNQDVFLNNTGDVQIVSTFNPDGSTIYQTKDVTAGNIFTKTAALGNALISNIQAGLINTKELVADNSITTPEIKTTSIVSEGSDLLINLENTNDNESQANENESGFGKLLVKGNAEFSGHVNVSGDTHVAGNVGIGQNLSADSISVNQLQISENLSAIDASISGELYADSARFKKLQADSIEGIESVFDKLSTDWLKTQNISGLEQEIESPISTDSDISDNPSTISENPILEITGDTATDSANLFALAESWTLTDTADDLVITAPVKIQNNLSVLGVTTLAQTIIAGPITQDGTLFIDNGNSISVLAGTLYLQNISGGGIDLLAGKVTIDQNGDAIFEGNLTVKGVFMAGVIKPNNSGNINLDLGINSESQAKLLVSGNNGEAVFSLDASGSAQFTGDLASTGLKIVRDAIASEPDFNGMVVSTASAGLAYIPEGRNEIGIKADKVTENSLIYLTPVGPTDGLVLYLARIRPNEKTFYVGIDRLATSDIKFNWWIIN